jgi:hypothetical protein
MRGGGLRNTDLASPLATLHSLLVRLGDHRPVERPSSYMAAVTVRHASPIRPWTRDRCGSAGSSHIAVAPGYIAIRA